MVILIAGTLEQKMGMECGTEQDRLNSYKMFRVLIPSATLLELVKASFLEFIEVKGHMQLLIGEYSFYYLCFNKGWNLILPKINALMLF